MEAVTSIFHYSRFKFMKDGAKSIFVPHYLTNVLLSITFFILKTLPPVCEFLFENCNLELKQWEWLTFLGCVIVLKNRKQVTVSEYVSVACMFAKVLNLVLFYQINVSYAIVYGILCLLHFVFLPTPVYKGPEFVTYFRGPHLKNEIARDKRVTWLICFYAAWSPPCVNLAPVFAEISSEYCLDNLQFGKLDVSKFSEEAKEFKVNTSSFSKQLPTLIMFQDGKEKMRRPVMSAKGTVIKHTFTKTLNCVNGTQVSDIGPSWPFRYMCCSLSQQNIISDFELNEVYNQCKKILPRPKKDKDLQTEKKQN